MTLEMRPPGRHAHQDQFLATQTFELLGIEILRLRYVIAPEPQEGLLA